MEKQKIIAQGAEAIITLEENKIKKHRIKKSYRIEELDERIRKLRTRSETKLLKKAGEIVSIPRVIKSDEKEKEIIMDFVDGRKLSEHLDTFPLTHQKQILEQIGESVAKLHDNNIIHGDLTTSNMILDEDKRTSLSDKEESREGGGSGSQRGGSKRSEQSKQKIFFIDFGLGYISHKFEDKAVDIHLLKQALEAKHFKNSESLFNEFEKAYKKTSSESEKTFNQLIKVEKRGRYKH